MAELLRQFTSVYKPIANTTDVGSWPDTHLKQYPLQTSMTAVLPVNFTYLSVLSSPNMSDSHDIDS